MATSTSCSKCEKGTDIYFCIGCETSFCKEDYQHHQETMANQLDGFIEDCNDLQDKINKAMEHKNFDSPLLIEIDEWEKTTIEKVKQVAEQARQQVVQLMNSKKVKIKAQFEKFSQKLIQLKEPNDFVEHDLKQLEQTVHQLNQDLKQLSQVPEIQLHMEQSNQTAWDSLIYVEEKPVYTIKQELQRQVNEHKQPTAPSYQRKLNCAGHACPKCIKCWDWYYVDDHYAKRNDATCNRDYVSHLFLDDPLSSIYDDTLYSNDDSLYHGHNVICQLSIGGLHY